MEIREKSSSAFLTISEVSDLLGTPQHIIRFWETKFPQVRPLKRAGGRRYFRPEDVTLLQTISHLLAQDGYSIRGVQKLLREGEIKRTPLGARREAPLPLGLEEHDKTYSRVEDEATQAEITPPLTPVRSRKSSDDKFRAVLTALLDELVEMKKSLTR